jgi:hypothetical protein
LLPLIGFSLVFAIILCMHAVKTGQQTYWLWIILAFQPLGGVVYLLAIILPELINGSTGRRIGKAAKEALDPTRAYRDAKTACDDSPTVGNRMRLAQAASELGKYDEAEALYREAAQGIHAEDTALLYGRAVALVELGRNEEALTILHQLGELGDKGRTPHAAVAMGRAYQALGKMAEAETAYEWALGKFAGLEAIARYCVFLAETGRKAEAEATMKEIDKRAAGAKTHFRKEAKAWRDFAAAGLARA